MNLSNIHADLLLKPDGTILKLHADATEDDIAQILGGPLDSVRSVESQRELIFSPLSELTDPENPLASRFAGQRLYGTVLIRKP